MCIRDRLKFLSIFTSNLDEFFMIRVGSLYDQTFLPKPQIDNKTGMTAAEQLHAIFAAAAPLYKKRDKLYREVSERLENKGITSLNMEQLGAEERKYTETFFDSYISPILSPQIINAHHPFPHLTNKALYVVVLLKIQDKTAFGIVPIPPAQEDVYKRQCGRYIQICVFGDWEAPGNAGRLELYYFVGGGYQRRSTGLQLLL